jgi:lipoate-protein ligase A
MLVDFEVDTMLKALRIPVEKLKAKEIDSVKERATCQRWELGSTPGLEDIKTAVRRGFERDLGIRLMSGGLMPEEEALFRDKLPHYRSPEWIDHVRPVYQRRDTLHAASKSEAGLVRYTLTLNRRQKQVKEVFITGDFLSYPARALYDLESELRGALMDRESIRCTVQRLFDEEKLCIPGMSFEDFVRPLDQIFRKPFYTKHADGFRRAGVPGILLDIHNTTCYELDLAHEAYAGGYDKQTSLNIELLKNVFGALGAPPPACS